jgi:PAS domain S-box-containing protein
VKEGAHLYVNKRFAWIFGYDSPEDIIGKPVGIVVHPDDVSMVTEMSRNRIKGEEVPSNYGFKGIKKNGEIVYIEVSAAVMMYRGETVNIVFLRDITRRKHAENAKIELEIQLLQAQKMEAVGQLAGGVAHDFNNILTTIIGYSDLMRMRMDENDPLRIYVEQILASAQKAAQLTHSLLAFSRKQVIELKPHNVNDIIHAVQKILARLLTEDIELKTDLADADLMVLVDETQIDQVLMNLATNARDSMPDGGRLYIETRQFLMDDGFVKRNAFGKEGSYALISVSDTGIGIVKGMVDKIFEPFFTTKEVGKGTGLGLAIVYGIIKQHNGHINVYSEPGKGTTFNIYIPLVRIKSERPAAVVKEDIKGGNETILLAEDNAEVRMLTKIVLESKGYTVIEAIDGEAAIKIFEENKDGIGMVILDVVMPKKNGKEVNEAIQKIKPGIHVLFISGYTADIVFDKGVKDIGINYISKPLLPDELLKKVRAVIDKT